MFISELTPLGQEFIQQPVAFVGGFLAGVFKLSLEEDPLKSWLAQQDAAPASPSAAAESNNHNGGSQSIAID